jgi:hypothetical protein
MLVDADDGVGVVGDIVSVDNLEIRTLRNTVGRDCRSKSCTFLPSRKVVD